MHIFQSGKGYSTPVTIGTGIVALVVSGWALHPALSATIETGDVVVEGDMSVCVNQNTTIIGE